MAEQENQATDTRQRILCAAEELFMRHGYAATSLRAITAKAGVNLAAVNYHFRSKDALICEIFERRLGPLNVARIAYLDELEAISRGRPLAVEQIMEAIIAPVLHMSKEPLARGAIFLRLLGRAFSEPLATLRDILPAHHGQVVIRFRQALRRSLPEMPDQELTWRMHFMFGALSYTLAGNDALNLDSTCSLADGEDAEAIMGRLIPFLAAGLQAPLPAVQTKRDLPGRKVA
jgi:AcrR family transcriptional regulator